MMGEEGERDDLRPVCTIDEGSAGNGEDERPRLHRQALAGAGDRQLVNVMPGSGHVFCYPPVAVDEVRQSPFEREHLPAKPGFKVIIIHHATGRASPLSSRVAHEDNRAADYRNDISRPTANFLIPRTNGLNP